MGYITGNFQTEKGMTYTIRKQDTITRNYGVFWGATLVYASVLELRYLSM
jgi:hypothetical protein